MAIEIVDRPLQQALCRSDRAASGEIVEELIAGYAFATSDLGHAFFEMLVQRGFVVDEPVFLIGEEIESVIDEFGRLAVGPVGEHALNALFGLSVEGEIHGGSIPLREIRQSLGSAGRFAPGAKDLHND